jgi:general secretion pathway protein M
VMRLSLSVRRLLAVALLLATVLLAWSGLVAPLLDSYAEATSSVERLQQAVERSRMTGRDLAALQAELAELRARQSSADGFLSGANESIAAAQLQVRLKAAVDRAGGDLRSTQILASRDEGRFRRITVRGQMLLRTSALQRIIYELEAASPYLFLDNVEIRARGEPGGRDRAAAEDPPLDIRLDLSSYVRKAV